MFKKSKVIVIEKRANDNGLLLNSILKMIHVFLWEQNL